MKIYVASSWRNTVQPHVVRMLRAFGHEVYDFKNPGAVKCKDCDGEGARTGLLGPDPSVGRLAKTTPARIPCTPCRGHGYLAGDKIGFGWAQLGLGNDADWDQITYLEALRTARAQEGFKADMDALRDCQVCVLVQPCGNSAHLELGWAIGARKRTAVLLESKPRADLMLLAADKIFTSMNGDDGLIQWINDLRQRLLEDVP